MKILFITRKFPPSTGGMETAAHELYSALSKDNKVKLIKWGGSNRWLIFVYPILLIRSLISAVAGRPDVIYLQDGVMAPLGWILKKILRLPSVITIHGLEITYQNKLYVWLIRSFVGKQTAIVSVSKATKAQIENIFERVKVKVINNGLKDTFFLTTSRASERTGLAKACGLDPSVLKNAKILHTNGRLVRRKGVYWFVENVLPDLIERDKNIIYLVSGSGEDKSKIIQAAKKYKVESHVKLLGRIPQNVLKNLYNSADIFVMPNIPIKDDIEGFGLVALEAASCGTTVIASNIEGIQDAIIDGKNGFLIPAGSKEAYIDKIYKELKGPSLKSTDIRNFTLNKFNWRTVATEYETLMKEIIYK